MGARAKVMVGLCNLVKKNVTDEEFTETMLALLKEVWSRPDVDSHLFELWFDGGENNPSVDAMVAQFQPTAVAVSGTLPSGNNANLAGKESGFVPYPYWNANWPNSGSGGDPVKGPDFVPAECSTPIYDRDAWFWKPNLPLRSLAELQSVYLNTVGTNSVLELGIEPDATGIIPADQMTLLHEFGDWIRRCYGIGAAIGRTSGQGRVMRINFENGKFPIIDKLVLQENQSGGQQVLAYEVWVLPHGGYDPSFVNAGSGSSVGNKRIHVLSTGPVPVQSIYVNATALVEGFENVLWENVAAYAPCT